jgi:hypothetical protein
LTASHSALWGTSAAYKALIELWEEARRKQAGRRPTQERLARESDVRIQTINDWLTGKHAPRDLSSLLAVVKVMSRWAAKPPPRHGEWQHLLHLHTQQPQKRPHSSMQDAIDRAFRARNVSVKAMSLTAEEASIHVARAVEGILAGTNRPEAITLRLLVPAPGMELAYPRRIDIPEDTRVRQRFFDIQRTYLDQLCEKPSYVTAANSLKSDVGIRCVPFTPSAQMYLLNDHELLLGYYQVAKNSMWLRDEDAELVDVYDALTLNAPLRAFTADNLQDTEFVAESLTWFDSLWHTIAKPMR